MGLVRKLLILQDFRGIVLGMDPLDIELLLDFILYVSVHSLRSLVFDYSLPIATPK